MCILYAENACCVLVFFDFCAHHLMTLYTLSLYASNNDSKLDDLGDTFKCIISAHTHTHTSHSPPPQRWKYTHTMWNWYMTVVCVVGLFRICNAFSLDKEGSTAFKAHMRKLYYTFSLTTHFGVRLLLIDWHFSMSLCVVMRLVSVISIVRLKNLNCSWDFWSRAAHSILLRVCVGRMCKFSAFE